MVYIFFRKRIKHILKIHSIKAISDYIDKLISKISILILLIFTLIIIIQVFFRYFLHQPLLWTEEVARFLMIWMIFLSLSLVAKRRKNVCIELFLEKFPINIQQIISIISNIFIIYFLIILLILSIDLINSSARQLAPATRIPMNCVYISLPLGVLFLLIQMIYVLSEDITNCIRFYKEKKN